MPIPAPLFAVGYLAYSWWSARQNTGRINHDAHLGGALAGLAFVAVFDPAGLGARHSSAHELIGYSCGHAPPTQPAAQRTAAWSRCVLLLLLFAAGAQQVVAQTHWHASGCGRPMPGPALADAGACAAR